MKFTLAHSGSLVNTYDIHDVNLTRATWTSDFNELEISFLRKLESFAIRKKIEKNFVIMENCNNKFLYKIQNKNILQPPTFLISVYLLKIESTMAFPSSNRFYKNIRVPFNLLELLEHHPSWWMKLLNFVPDTRTTDDPRRHSSRRELVIGPSSMQSCLIDYRRFAVKLAPVGV